MRRIRRLGGLLTALLLAGCTGVPTTGPVTHYSSEPVGISTGVAVAPLPPSDGASQLLVVEGFLHAMSVYQSGYRVAREYLTDQASKSWHPESGVQVYADGYPPEEIDQTVVLVAPLVGAIDASGVFVAASGQFRQDFNLVKNTAGQWRISNPPVGLLISKYLFGTSFDSVSLHFFDSTDQLLVPDPRYFASGGMAAAQAVKALLAGPSAWLRPSVRKPETSGVEVESVVGNASGLATVTLGGRAAQLTAAQREPLVAEIVYTLSSFEKYSAVTVDFGGSIWTAESGRTQVFTDDFAKYSPTGATADRILYVVKGGKFKRQRQIGEWTDLSDLQLNLPKASKFAVSSNLNEVAAVVDGRLLTATVGGAKAKQLRAAAGLLRPDYTRTGELWSPTTSLSGFQVYRESRAVKLDVSGLPNSAVVAASISPDGARVALVLKRGSTNDVGLARVERSDSGIVLTGWHSLEQVLTTSGSTRAVDVGWESETQLAVLRVAAALQSSVTVISQDGSQQSDIGPSDSTQLSALTVVPNRPAVAVSAQRSAYRFDGEFNWIRVTDDVDGVAYSD